MSSSSSNISQSTFSTSDQETSQNTVQRIQNFDQSLNHGDIGHSIEQSLRNAQKEMHQKRIQALRKELDYLKNSEWKYDFEKGHDEVQSDEDKEIFLSDQLLQLHIEEEKNKPDNYAEIDVPNDTKCFQRNGIITHCDENYVLINGNIYYDISNCPLKFNTNDSVLYLGYIDSNDRVVIVRILENQGFHWSDEFHEEEQNFDIIERVLVGLVEKREERFVFINDSDLKFNLDDVEGTFIPIKGDWIEMKCSVQKQTSNKLTNITTNQVLKVVSFKALRSNTKSAMVTEYSGGHGICDKQIYFDSYSVVDGVQVQKGCKVMVEAIESSQGTCSWRALKVLLLDSNKNQTSDVLNKPLKDEEDCRQVETDKNIEVTYPLKFDINMNHSECIKLNIINKSNHTYTLNKWIILTKKRDSQINVKPFLNTPVMIESGNLFSFTIVCYPKFYGKSRETLILLFKGFQVKRFVEINVVNDLSIVNISERNNGFPDSKKIEHMLNIRKNESVFVPGVKAKRNYNFVPVKLGLFPIPDKIWSVVLDESGQDMLSNEYDNIITRMEQNLPCLRQELNIFNYTDKWHTLLYMEEIQENLNMRVHDKSNVFLVKSRDFLEIEIPRLAESRPSLIEGDRVMVKDAWDVEASQYEGFIHEIKGNSVLMKFNPQFHETYNGSDVSIEFHFIRTVYRRAHSCVNAAISNLGADVLFPSKLKLRQPEVTDNQIQNIKWYNDRLNRDQKNAVCNILKGECRPMPYIIFGPPGTGKTITVIETILQILLQIPGSRILIATPSNSASNLVTERLIHNSFSGSVVRIVAKYLINSDSIPESIRPYCDIVHMQSENAPDSVSIALPWQKSSIARHRVIIGTCNALGALKYLDLPRGHFTHVIVDEAGQATEPEIMIPLTFIDRDYGQIILAGDPMQLGPFVISKYCKEYGMDESYLCRILQTFPYQKDKDAFESGFDNRLVTKLNENYRSVEEVLKLPSDMFYDGSLVVKMNKDISEIMRLKSAISKIFELAEINDGGGIFVYGIDGTNTRAEDSPSWYNPQEASMVALTTCKLYKNDVDVDEIGIITPYVAQTKYLRLLFDSLGLPKPKIGTVEEFQGQERPIILISTVRSAESYLSEDYKHALGFLKNPKRLNVAITRAQISVILFCNPYLLTKDGLWNKVIENAVSMDKYRGCELPSEYSHVLESDQDNRLKISF